MSWNMVVSPDNTTYCTFAREHQRRRPGMLWLLCQPNFARSNDFDLHRFGSRRRRHVLTDVLEHGRVT